MKGRADPLRSPLLSVSHYACPEDLPFAAFSTAVADAGYGAVALTRRSFEELGAKDIAALLRSRELKVSSVNSAGYFLDIDPERSNQQAADNQRLLQLTAETEAHGLNVIVGGIAGSGQMLQSARSRAQESLATLGDDARRLGVQLLVEPIHPAGVTRKGCLNTIRQVSEAIGSTSNASLTIDLYHSWWDPELCRILSDEDARVGLLQICDVSTSDAGFDVLRAIPGAGIVDIRSSVTATARNHPSAPIELEVFAEHYADFDLIASLRDVRAMIARWGVGATCGDDERSAQTISYRAGR